MEHLESLRKIIKKDVEFKDKFVDDLHLAQVLDYIEKRDNNLLEDGNYKLCYEYKDNQIKFFKVMSEKRKKEINSAKITKIDDHTFIEDCNFEDIDKTNPVKNEIYQYFINFINGVNGYENPLYIYGKSGSGKSFLLSTLSNELIKKGDQVAFLFLPIVYREYIANKFEIIELFRQISNYDCVVFDEFGSGMIDVFFRDNLLFPLISYRLLNKKPLFFASNRTLKDAINNYVIKDDQADRTSIATIGRRIKAMCVAKELN